VFFALKHHVVCQLAASDGSEKCLQFAALPWNCETYDCITLVNRGMSAIPVRLVISSVRMGRCFLN